MTANEPRQPFFRTQPLELREDDRGDLFEVVRLSDLERAGAGPIRQVYVVRDYAARVVRAFHRHALLTDWFTVVRGAAVFALVGAQAPDDDEDPESPKDPAPTARVVLTARRPQLLTVPPGTWHGWMSLEPETTLLCVADREYDREHPDEERVPPTVMGFHFGGDPWAVVGR